MVSSKQQNHTYLLHMRKWMLYIHLHAGLLCSSYLLLYGISALDFNHEFISDDVNNGTTTWTRTLILPDLRDDSQLAEHVRDELGLSGWPLSWTISSDENGNLRYDMAQPAKFYTIHVTRATALVTVEETRRGLWHAIRGLHGLSAHIPGMPVLSRMWTMFTEITNWVVLFSACSGVYLWLSRREDRLAGWSILIGAGVLSIGFMAYLWLWG